MKKIILTIFLVAFSLTIKGQVSNALSLHGGGSWANGNLGVEYQVLNYSVGVGVARGMLPSKSVINSLCGSITYYNKYWDKSSGYITVGAATSGFMKEIKAIPFYAPIPSIIILTGLKGVINKEKNFSCRSGVGVNINQAGTYFEFEFLLSFTICHNR